MRKARVQRASRRAGRFSSALNSTHACAAKHTHPNHFWSTDLPQIWFSPNIAFAPGDNFERRYSQEISVTVKAKGFRDCVCVFGNREKPAFASSEWGEGRWDVVWSDLTVGVPMISIAQRRDQGRVKYEEVEKCEQWFTGRLGKGVSLIRSVGWGWHSGREKWKGKRMINREWRPVWPRNLGKQQ